VSVLFIAPISEAVIRYEVRYRLVLRFIAVEIMEAGRVLVVG
jgi:hypothetical protein